MSSHDWSVLYWLLGVPDPRDIRGSLLVFTLEATGWAGIAAARVAPALYAKPFYYFYLFLIANGLFHDFIVIRGITDPRASGYMNIRAVLRELRQLRQQDTSPTKTSDGPPV